MDRLKKPIQLLAVVHGPTFVEDIELRASMGLGIVTELDEKRGVALVKWKANVGTRIARWEFPESLQILSYRTIEETMTHQEADIREVALTLFKQQK